MIVCFFFRAKQSKCDVIVNILNCYEKCLGQLINFNKSGVLFSANTSHNAKVVTKTTIGVYKDISSDSYFWASYVV